MSEVIDVAESFELELELPNDRIEASSKGLVGFEKPLPAASSGPSPAGRPGGTTGLEQKVSWQGAGRLRSGCGQVSTRYFRRGRRDGENCHCRRCVRQIGSGSSQGGNAL